MTFSKFIQLTLVPLLLGLSMSVQAMTLQQAMGQLPTYKSQGIVGEKPNGYLGAVVAKPAANELVELINNARLAQYKKMAQSNKIELSKLEALAGKKSIQKTHAGHYIQLNGAWVKK